MANGQAQPPAEGPAEAGRLQRMLGEWSQFEQRLMVRCTLPQLQQFRLMLGSPFNNQTQCTRWKVSPNDYQRANINDGLVLSILRVEVRRRMVTKIHLDDNAQETANFRHPEPTHAA